MKKIGLLFMAGICIVVLFLGHLHWNNMSKAAGIEGKKAADRIKEKEKKERQALIQSLRPENNKQQSLIDYLHYKSLTKDKAIISILGSNGTAGTGASNSSNSWAGRLEKNLHSESVDLATLSLINRGHEGYSTTDLLEGKKIDSIIKDNPDLVIFENSLINNHNQSISLEQTENDLINIMSNFQKKLPNTKILMISPNPVANSKTENSIGFNYLDYIKVSEKIIKKNNWNYIDSVQGIQKKLKDENIILADILSEDNIHLNDQGYHIWSEVLYDYFRME
ncbi:SGNH/GDSL hydrolase family protein [Peribacillus frigoritolerans]|uniref:SGNH/GDSL hydrolase family protein n=1 Tax=Peribacillus frigoritolerans TaxID=450367 RepID=UPI002E1F538A|nr:SGNH/GDSL hydrolase family protein [Peribacillus frigoritolerans]MED3844547.1 SGNH/GDSL hydrolase family protein [Peribacillus frigoritolerans]